jgi:hypothetical protein
MVKERNGQQRRSSTRTARLQGIRLESERVAARQLAPLLCLPPEEFGLERDSISYPRGAYMITATPSRQIEAPIQS